MERLMNVLSRCARSLKGSPISESRFCWIWFGSNNKLPRAVALRQTRCVNQRTMGEAMLSWVKILSLIISLFSVTMVNAAISTSGVNFQRFAVGMYGTALNAQNIKDLTSEVSSGNMQGWANEIYTLDFSKKTDHQVAAIMLENLGLNQVPGLQGWVAAQLIAAGAANKGAKILNMLEDFSGLTSDATYGAYATAFNNVVNAALSVPTPITTTSSTNSTASTTSGLATGTVGAVGAVGTTAAGFSILSCAP